MLLPTTVTAASYAPSLASVGLFHQLTLIKYNLAHSGDEMIVVVFVIYTGVQNNVLLK